jgi:hypothetical protein
VGLNELNQQAEQDEKAAVHEAAQKENQRNKIFESNRQGIRSAETKLREVKTPSRLKVGEMKLIIISRSGHGAKSKNNKVVGDEEGGVLQELRAAIKTQSETLCPATPPPRTLDPAADGAADAMETEADEPDDEVPTCDGCGRHLEREEEDYRFTDGLAFCVCGERCEDLESA